MEPGKERCPPGRNDVERKARAGTTKCSWEVMVMADHVEDTPQDIAATRRLHKYWTTGEGGLKIQWGVPGDGTRCKRIALLSKYMPGRAAGYCQNLHQEMTGQPMGHGPGEEALHKASEALKDASRK